MLLLFSHLLIIAVCLVMRIVGWDESIIGLFFTIVSSFIVIVYIFSLKWIDNTTKILILFGFIVRVILVAIDVFVVRIPEAGFDDDDFYRTSVNIYNGDYALFSKEVYGGFFSKMLSVIYFFIGSSRLSIQYTNVLFFVVAAILLARTLTNLKVSEKTIRIGVGLICLLPNTILHNSILRRETVIELCVCLSLFFFSNWYNKKNLFSSLLSILFVTIASLFHTVFIFSALILALYYVLYDKKKLCASFSIKKIGKFIIFLMMILAIGLNFLSLFNNKFSSVDSLDVVYTTANRARGGSVYLEGYEVHNIGQLILFTPLKLFFFLFSPVPWKFRNATDVIMFFSDALVYIILIIIVLRAKRTSTSNLMVLLFITLSVVFALGTFNSGTAIRHRFSVLPYLLVAYCTIEKRSKKEYRYRIEKVQDIDRERRIDS